MKKILCIILTAAMVLSSVPLVFASSTDAKLREIYDDDMLFRQNSVSSVSGTASAGSVINIEFRSENNVITATGKAGSDGTFAVDFTAPAGGYTTYTLTAKQNGTTFAELKNIVFGELWLASGQSNMQYNLGGTFEGTEMMNNGETGSEWLRVLYVEPVSTYNGSTDETAGTPQEESIGANWFCGNDALVYGCSAVGYFFGMKMLSKLDVPVGIISCSLGGSAISTWLSRESIDGNSFVKNALSANGEYFDAASWNSTERSQYYDMTANYNMKIYPLRHLNVSGFIWYQGETDVIYKHSPGLYGEMIDLLQQTFTENFRYEGGSMPMVFTQLAAYDYGDNADLFNEMNNAFLDMQQEKSDSRAVISIYDVTLDYYESVGPIHPGYKQPVGERMADCAYKLVYNYADNYTAPTVSKTEIKDGKVYVTYRNTGDGLVCDGTELKGFSVCGDDGIYVKAEAEIVSRDTVAVWTGSIENPVSACYAYVINNQECNLYASENGEKALPAGSFITDKNYMNNLYDGMFFADCCADEVWHNQSNASGFKDAWSSFNCDEKFTENGLNITAETTVLSHYFSVSPVLSYKDKLSTVYYDDTNRDFTDYGTVVMEITNSGSSDVNVSELRFYTGAITYYSAVTDAVIPADGQPHTVIFNLNDLYKFGNKGGVSYANEVLDEISAMSFIFNADGGESADITIGSFSVTADDGEKTKNTYPDSPDTSGNLFEFFTSLLMCFIGLFKNFC